MRQRRPQRRWRGIGRAAPLVAAVLLAVTAQGGAVAAPAGPASAHHADRTFTSSFESGDPQPDWRDTVETGPDGKKKASGVDGGYSSGIPGNVTDKVTEVRASGENTEGGEVKENLVDGELTSKWLAFDTTTAWLEFDLSEPVKAVRYALTSANDAPGRDPKDWTLKGSANGSDWTTLDTRKDETFSSRQQTREFSYRGARAYQHFRLEITRNAGDNLIQLAEVQFATGDTTPPAPTDMRTLIDRGPTGSPTAKANAGFTGTHALRYAGTHKPDGRAYSYNKVFDVDTAVTRDTRLSYRIFPSMPETDLNYPATHVSVDLAFTDGTYLSDLPGAVDQHGARMSPQGQAASKTLYVNQWNHKESR
ncbi:discoidin domain-containing protein, partial [Streptomyces niphimycinicus]|uniref:discoidin domain-containing protein n=1 Tax=Streptomyces niphimycinicus TaxID=2842201 RepID=UPI00209B1F9D